MSGRTDRRAPSSRRPHFPKHLVPYFPSLPIDNVRRGFFERAEVEALLPHVADDGIRDFIAWGFCTGMRKGEIARLTWDMLEGAVEGHSPGRRREVVDAPERGWLTSLDNFRSWLILSVA